jgi:acyl-CoA synthetase (AMP-forming)/AMP-acid ligase II
MGLHDLNFYDLIRRNQRCYGEREAWLELKESKIYSFDQIKNMVDHLATGLRNRGIQKGDRIGAIGKNSLEYFLLYGAASALGLIVVPVNWRFGTEEIERTLADCKPRLIFSDVEFQESIERLRKKLTFVEAFYNLSTQGGIYEDLNELLDNKAHLEVLNVSSNDGLVLIYTAAVEETPKGALLSHNNLISVVTQFSYIFGVYDNDVHLNVLPLFHVAGLSATLMAFYAGALNINMERFDAGLAADLIDERKVSIIFEFAPMLEAILDECEKRGKDIASLKVVAGLDNEKTIKRFQDTSGGEFFSIYGQTEVSALVTISPYNEMPGSAGKPLPLADLRILDDHEGEVKPGEIGEIAVRGPLVFTGYWNLPDANKYTFRNGWHHTGDLGYFDNHGFLWYAGRKKEKELIKPGGENVYPVEVERVILGHPAVEKAVVFGVPDPKWKEAVKAVCKLKVGKSLDAGELIDFVGKRIARYKKPKYVEFVTNFPVLEDGSPDRAKTKKLYGGV